MGTIEETRKLVPEVLAPELREIKARLDALEGINRTGLDAVQGQLDTVHVQFAALDDIMKSRFDAQDKVIEAQSAMDGGAAYGGDERAHESHELRCTRRAADQTQERARATGALGSCSAQSGSS